MHEEPPHQKGPNDRRAKDDPKSGAGQVTFLASELRHDHLKPALKVGDVGSQLIGLAQGGVAFVGHARVVAD